MVLELHVWGPAFELPSIDAQCLATILYLRSCLQHRDWVLVPSSNPCVSPLGELPALLDGDVWVAGYLNIISYLRDISGGKWDLDQELDVQQQADKAALTAFIISRGQPLLDLSLYVSSDNYHNSTRPALAAILTWPNSWTIPHRLREQAKKRSEHLGLSSLDVDTAQEEEDKKENLGLTAHIPKSLRKPKQTVTGLLGRNQQKNRFRLDAVTDDFFDPLSEMLGEKPSLLGGPTNSADCLATGYLALMQRPQLQHGWLSESLRSKHTRLDEWARRQIAEPFGTPSSKSPSLPWKGCTPRSMPQICHELLEGCIGSLPVLGSYFSGSEIWYLHATDRGRYREKHLQLARLQRRREIYVDILTATFASAGLISWLIHDGILRLPRWSRPTPSQTRFGEAGALLGLG
ncbi:mitochondrial import receptor subunit [Cladophialophora carrionii]|uniref:Mitochondrial import receptor subunit n=1 Tax=Cladophialophora carrionii TaxID=86049 RepID=A0A1C1D117_9EURO|nr:mitochondrial import receptor subunit [Cladophialophora carrionii]